MQKAESVKIKLLEQNKELEAEFQKTENEFKTRIRSMLDAEKKETGGIFLWTSFESFNQARFRKSKR